MKSAGASDAKCTTRWDRNSPRPSSTCGAFRKFLCRGALVFVRQRGRRGGGPGLAPSASLSYLLHPPFAEDMGLLTALRYYVEGVSQRTESR